MSDIPDKIYVCKETNGYGLCAEYADYPSSKLKPYIKASLVKELLGAIDEMGKYYQLSLEVNEIAGELRELVNE